MKKVMVFGAGTMGAGIAQVVAEAGHAVILRDVSDDLVQKGMATIDKNLARAVEKGRITPEKRQETLSSIKGLVYSGNGSAGFETTDLVIEAIVEEMAIKKSLYQDLDRLCPPDTIFATNTSALSVTELAASTTRPAKFVGLHFFNPAPMMQLVEVVAGAVTSPETVATATEFVKEIGKIPVNVADSPGFIVNRVLFPMINEAAFVLLEGLATPEDIDSAMRLGANHPIGPLALADLIGLDVALAVLETLQRESGDPKYRPCPILRKMVRAGFLGRKTGQGFYKY
jgi:3-hydroxybutyryl-CoA dehydrogenase